MVTVETPLTTASDICEQIVGPRPLERDLLKMVLIEIIHEILKMDRGLNNLRYDKCEPLDPIVIDEIVIRSKMLPGNGGFIKYANVTLKAMSVVFGTLGITTEKYNAPITIQNYIKYSSSSRTDNTFMFESTPISKLSFNDLLNGKLYEYEITQHEDINCNIIAYPRLITIGYSNALYKLKIETKYPKCKDDVRAFIITKFPFAGEFVISTHDYTKLNIRYILQNYKCEKLVIISKDPISILASYLYTLYLVIYIRYHDKSRDTLTVLEDLYEKSMSLLLEYHPEDTIALNHCILAAKMLSENAQKQKILEENSQQPKKWWFW